MTLGLTDCGEAMATQTKTTSMTTTPSEAACGARITGIDLCEVVDKPTAHALRDALAHHAVLCFPAQRLAVQDQLRFAALFGKADSNNRPKSGQMRERGALLVSNIRKDGQPVGVLPDGEIQFHSDGSHRDVHYRATTLYAIKIPSRGGETLFADLRAAYDALSPALKDRLDGLSARHVYDVIAQHREETDEDDETLSSAIHPLVRVHPDSGRRALYLSRLMTMSVVSMAPAEGDALLSELFDHVERPDFIYTHRWARDDLVIWDNRSVNHARVDFPSEEPRLLRRYTVSEP